MSLRPVKLSVRAQQVVEGAGFKANRAFGNSDTDLTDPFLLLDHIQSDNPDDYRAGAPWHPHRGIETITYIIDGSVEHEDSLGNSGTIGAGGVQWMTAGSGIIHQEMPKGDAVGTVHGFQLWANLPADKKMADPRYQDIRPVEIPEFTDDDGVTVRVVTGEFWGRRGPVEGIAADPCYLDIAMPANTNKTFAVEVTKQAFAYLFDGTAMFRGASAPRSAPTEYVRNGHVGAPELAHPADNRTLVLFDTGDEIRVTSGPGGVRFLLVSGEPLREPVAWYGPIVMNTREQLVTAFEEYQAGTFLKHG